MRSKKMSAEDEQDFEEWWSKNGQFLRSGGGEYEKTFAYHAWEHQAATLNFYQEWNAARYQRLFVWAHEKLDESRKTEYFNIVANGTESVQDDNNYMRLLNQAKYRAQSAESTLKEATDMLRMAFDLLDSYPDDYTESGNKKLAQIQTLLGRLENK